MTHQDRASEGLVAVGYVTAVLLPIVGFFVGLALVIKNRAGHGVAAMILSVIVVVVVAGALASLSDPAFEAAPAAAPVETPWCNPWNDIADEC